MRILKPLMLLFAASAFIFPTTSKAQNEAQKAEAGQTVKLRSTMVGKERMVLVPLKGCVINTPLPPYCWLQ